MFESGSVISFGGCGRGLSRWRRSQVAPARAPFVVLVRKCTHECAVCHTFILSKAISSRLQVSHAAKTTHFSSHQGQLAQALQLDGQSRKEAT